MIGDGPARAAPRARAGVALGASPSPAAEPRPPRRNPAQPAVPQGEAAVAASSRHTEASQSRGVAGGGPILSDAPKVSDAEPPPSDDPELPALFARARVALDDGARRLREALGETRPGRSTRPASSRR